MDRNNKIESVIGALSSEHLTSTEVNLNVEKVNLTVNKENLNTFDTTLSHFTDSNISNNTIENFIFSPLQIASHDYLDDDSHLNNWISIDADVDLDSITTVTPDNQWNDGIDQGDLLNKETLSRLLNIYKDYHHEQTPSATNDVYKYYGNNISISDTYKYSRRVHIEGNDVNPAYSSRGVLPIFNSNNDVKFYVKIRHIGHNGTGGSTNYNLWGIGIMRKFNSFSDNGTPKYVDSTTEGQHLKNSWDTKVDKNLAATYALRPQDTGAGTDNSKIFQSNKIMIRMRGDTNLYIKDIEVPFYGRLNASFLTPVGTFTIDNLVGFSPGTDTNVIRGILGHYRIIGLGENIPLEISSVSYNDNGIYQIVLESSETITGNLGDLVGFTKLTGDFTDTTAANDGGQPSGMGYNYHKSYGTSKSSSESGESMLFADFAPRGAPPGSGDQPDGTHSIIDTKIDDDKLDLLHTVGGVVGFEITSATSVNTDRTKPIRLITFYGQKDGQELVEGAGLGTKVKLAEKELPELYFDSDKKLHTIKSLDSSSLLDGPWCPFVFDSTGASHTVHRDITLEIIKPI